MRVTVWNEYFQEQTDERIAAVYPDGIHMAIAKGLVGQREGLEVATATMDEPEHGLSSEVLEATDVLLWWAHLKHGEISDEVVERVRRHVLGGMGLVLLHSGIESKVAAALLGTTCKMSWWRHGGRELIWTVEPSHEIAEGLPNPMIISEGEMYGEPLDVPTPDDLVFITAYEGGEVLRSGCGWKRGRGRVFFLAAGHEEHPIYERDDIQRALGNIVHWAAPRKPHTEASFAVPMMPEGWWKEPSSGHEPPPPH